MRKSILVAGATGYIGRKLIQRLQELGYPIRCLVRNPDYLRDPRMLGVDLVLGDLLNFQSLPSALAGMHTAFYLAHSLEAKKDFAQLERQAAEHFARAAKRAGLRRIIYLGALGSRANGPLSPHLESRKEVGDILRSSGIQVIEFQASIILGAGSLSFEMIRALSERLPVMLLPRWVGVKAQPISVRDVMDYLVQAVELPPGGHEIFEIGGGDQVSYRDLIREYADQRRLKRWLIPVPVLTPRLSSLWLNLVTPVYSRVGRKLIESIKNPTVVQDPKASRMFPAIRPMGVSQAIGAALEEGAPAQPRPVRGEVVGKFGI